MPIGVIVVEGIPRKTISKEASDSPQALDATDWLDQHGKEPEQAVITVEDNPVRIAFQTTPVPETTGHTLAVDDILKLNSMGAIRALRFVNEEVGQNSTLQITFQY